MLGVWLRRGLQPSTVRASSVGGDNVMEMNSPAGKMSSSTVGWGQLPSQNSRPLTLCYAGKQTEVQGLTPQQEMQKSQWVQQLHDFQVKQKAVLQDMQQQQQQQLQQLQQQQASANMPEPERQQQLQQLQQQHSSQLQELTKQQQEQSDAARNQLKDALEQLGIPEEHQNVPDAPDTPTPAQQQPPQMQAEQAQQQSQAQQQAQVQQQQQQAQAQQQAQVPAQAQ